MSDRLFGTDGIRGAAGEEPLTTPTLTRLGHLLGERLLQDADNSTPPTVLIGHDGRESGETLCAALTDGLTAAGAIVEIVGLAPTPTVAYLTATGDFSAGIVVSASHNPAADNGIKLLAADGSKCSEDFELSLEQDLVSTRKLVAAPQSGECRRSKGLLGDYVAWLRNEAFSELDLSGNRILIDCANGAWSQLCPRLLKAFGAEAVCINDRPDGSNINLECGTMYPEAMAAATRNNGCQLGLSVDGDGDRGILADGNGRLLDGDAILAGLGALMHARGALANDTVTATVMSNLALEKWCQQQGINLHRTPVGDRHVAAAMREKDLCLGGEKSGHILFGAEHGFRGDGIYTLLKVLSELSIAGHEIDAFADGYADMPQELRNLKVNERRPLEELTQLAAADIEVTADLGNSGRTVVRFSGTELKLRLMVEAETTEMVTAALDKLQNAACADGILS